MVARIASDDREFLEQYECFAHYFLFSQRVHSEYTNALSIYLWSQSVTKKWLFLILEMTYFRNTY